MMVAYDLLLTYVTEVFCFLKQLVIEMCSLLAGTLRKTRKQMIEIMLLTRLNRSIAKLLR